MTSRERLRRLYCHEEMDRPAAIIRWWGFRDDPSYSELFKLMTEQADWEEPWDPFHLIHGGPEIDWRAVKRSGGGKDHPLKDVNDAEQLLSMPLQEIGGDVSSYFQLERKIGDRGIAIVNLGNNPAGHVASLFGSEKFAILSVDERDMLHALMRHQQDVLLRLVDYLISKGIVYFSIFGQEMIAPPLHGHDDFFDFNVRYDAAIAERIHASGGRLNVHCHGRLKAVMDGFPAIGADVLHCFEAAPMGDVTPAEVKNAWRGRISLEGNIQIADFYEKPPEAIRNQTQALICDCFDDHRGFAVTPTASPFMPGRGRECYPQYLAMLETVKAFNS